VTYIGSYRRFIVHENQYFDVGAPIAHHLLNSPFVGRDRDPANPDPATNRLAFYPVFGFPQAPTISKSIAGYA
jgi:hypothetical protein